MTSTLTPTCSFCGLGFANRPLLELHIRDDHLSRDHRSKDPGPALDPHVAGPDRRHAQPTARSATDEMITMTRAAPPRSPRIGWAVTAVRRVAGVFRDAHAELLLVSEIMFRRPGASRRPRPSAGPAARTATRR
jgi:hypothetical protein